MTADLRELLQDVREYMRGNWTDEQDAALCKRIDAALAEPAPEPVETGLDERQYRLVADTEVEWSVPDGTESETLKAGTYVWLARWTEDQLEDARRNAEELHRKLSGKKAPEPAAFRFRRMGAELWNHSDRHPIGFLPNHLEYEVQPLYAASPPTVQSGDLPKWACDFLNRRAKVEEEMLRAVKAVKGSADAVGGSISWMDVEKWALRLGCPEAPPASPDDARARLTDARLRQMFEDYRDAWSPGARDELFAQYRAEIAAIEREGEANG